MKGIISGSITDKFTYDILNAMVFLLPILLPTAHTGDNTEQNTAKDGPAVVHHLKTLDTVLHLALIQLVDDVRLTGVLPRQFQSIKHRSTQLLYIMLLPRCGTHAHALTTTCTSHPGCLPGELGSSFLPRFLPPLVPEKNQWIKCPSCSNSTKGVKAFEKTLSTHTSQEKFTHWPHHFLIHHWTPERRGAAPFTLVLQQKMMST